MKIPTKIIVGAAALAAATFSVSAAQASDGTITINGQITAQTCTINGGGGGNDFTVTLPTVSSAAFAAAGSTAGRAAFNIVLTACTPTTGNVSVSFEQGGSVDNVTSRLLNTSSDPGAATNVQIQILNGNGTPIAVGQPVATQNSLPVALSAGAATLTYAAQYYATGGVPTAGPVTTSVVYSLNYN